MAVYGAQEQTELLVHLANLRITDPYKTIVEDFGRMNGPFWLWPLDRNPPGHRLHIRLELSWMGGHSCDENIAVSLYGRETWGK
jgi:hypothetical protein